MIKIALGILDSFRWVFPPLGVDYKKLRSILWVKLTTDTRRTPGDQTEKNIERQILKGIGQILKKITFLSRKA